MYNPYISRTLLASASNCTQNSYFLIRSNILRLSTRKLSEKKRVFWSYVPPLRSKVPVLEPPRSPQMHPKACFMLKIEIVLRVPCIGFSSTLSTPFENHCAVRRAERPDFHDQRKIEMEVLSVVHSKNSAEFYACISRGVLEAYLYTATFSRSFAIIMRWRSPLHSETVRY